MKKTYINPEMEIVKLKTQYQLLAGSDMEVPISSDPVDSGTPGESHYDEFNW